MTQVTRLDLVSRGPGGVVWHAPLRDGSDLAAEAHALALGLRRRGERLRVAEPVPLSTDVSHLLSAELRRDVDAALLADVGPGPLAVSCLSPDRLDRDRTATFTVARATCSTDAPPQQLVQRLNRLDEVWVAGRSLETALRAAGVTTPVHRVPGGVDADVHRPDGPELAVDGVSGTVFLSDLTSSSGSGWDLVLRAWASAFSPRDDVTLVLRAPTTDTAEAERRTTTFLARCGKSRRQVAPVVVVPGQVGAQERASLARAAHAYVAATRAGDWGRAQLEAMACGLPVVATRWGAQLDFLHDDNSLLVDVEGLHAVGDQSEVPWPVGQRWASPSVRHLVRRLQQVAADREAAGRLGVRGRADAVASWTWEHALDVVEERLDDIRTRVQPRSSTATARTAVRWEGDQFAHHSLSRVNREVCARLLRSPDLELELRTTEAPDFSPHGPHGLGLAAATGDLIGDAPDVTVRHAWPPDFTAPTTGAQVVVQPWEFGGLPDAWVAPMRDTADEVWCYTTWMRDCFVASGVPADKVAVVPLGVDPELFRPDGQRYDLPTTKSFRFLFLGGTTARKGCDVLLNTYLSTFTRDDDVCLVVKSFGSGTFYQGQNIDETIARAQADRRAPEIVLITDDLALEQVAALYRSCDAYVHPYRGEGFGLPLVEAMASGLPVITTGYGAALDFCHPDNSYLVPAEVRVLEAEIVGPSAAGHFLAEPDAGHLAACMRAVWTDPAEASARAERGRATVLAGFTWDHVGARVSERLHAVAERHRSRTRRMAVEPWPLDTAGRFALLHRPSWSSDSARDVLTTYLTSFGAQDPVTLVLTLEPEQGHPAEHAEQLLLEIAGATPAGVEGMPDVLLVPEQLTPDDIERLYVAADAVLGPLSPQDLTRAQDLGVPVVDSDLAALRDALAVARSSVAGVG